MLQLSYIKGLFLPILLDILCYVELMIIIVILLAGAAMMITRCDRAVWSRLILLPPEPVPLYTALFIEIERNK